MCNMMGFAAVFALLPKLQDRYGLPTWSLGVITATSVISSVAAQLSFSRFADRGHALLMMRIGIASMSVGFFWFAFATNVWAFALTRTLVGLGGGMFMPAARRTVVSKDPSRAGERLGLMVAVEVGGFVLGPPLAIALYSLGGLRLPFLAPVVLVLIAGSTLRVPPILVDAPEVPKGSVRYLLRMPAVRAAMLIGGAINLSIGAFEPVIAKQLTDLGSSDQAIGLTLATFALPYVLFSWFGGRFADRFGAYRTAVVAMVLTVPTIFLFGVVKSALMIAVVGLIRSIFDTIATPSGAAAMARAAPAHLLGTGQGIYGAVSNAMTGVAALIGAPIYGAYGARVMWTCAASAMLVITIYIAYLSRRAGVWLPAPFPGGASSGDPVSADPSPA